MPKARRGRGQDQDIVELLPTMERQAKGPIERLAAPIEDMLGEWSRPLIGLDTLLRMERARSIGAPERRAGSKIHDQFRMAHLDRLFAADMARMPVMLSNGNNWREFEGPESARLAVMSALDALGGPQSPGGSCAWHVLGCDPIATNLVTNCCSITTGRPREVCLFGGCLSAHRSMGTLSPRWVPRLWVPWVALSG